MLENIAAFFSTAEFAETVTVGGASVPAIVDDATDLVLSDVLTRARSLLLPASAVPAVSEGTAAVVRGVAHVVRQVLAEPPDGVLVRLVLARS